MRLTTSLLSRAPTACAASRAWLLILTLTACASSTTLVPRQTSLTDPREGTMLLLGAVIVGSMMADYYKPPTKLEVLIKGEIELESGETKLVSYLVETDEEGYFALENVPRGRWALQGVLIDENRLFWNDLRIPNERWNFDRRMGGWPSLYGDHWPDEPVENVYDFGIHVFVPSGIEHHFKRGQIDSESFGTPRSYTRPPILEHFIERYPDSGWIPTLKRLIGG